MADSAIAITALATTGGVGTITTRWTGNAGSCLGYLALDKFEIWASASNDRALASKIGETEDISFTQAGLAMPTTRYYWVRARDLSGNLGDFFPLSATAGIVGTTNALALQPLADAFSTAINTERTERIGGDQALAELVTAVVAMFNEFSAEANFRARAVAGPAGFAVSIVLEGRVDAGSSFVAGFYIDVDTVLGGRLRLKSGRTVIEDDIGNILALFNNGKVAVGRLEAGIIDAASLFVAGVVITDVIADHAVSSPVIYSSPTGVNVSAGSGNVNVAGASKTPANPLGRVEVTFTANLYATFNGSNNWGSFRGILYRDGVPIADCIARPDDENQDGLMVIRFVDTSPGSASVLWSVYVEYTTSPGPGANISCRNNYLSVLDYAK